MAVTDLSLPCIDRSDKSDQSDSSVTNSEKLIFSQVIDECPSSFVHQSESNHICQVCIKNQKISCGAFFMVKEQLPLNHFYPKKHMQK